MKIKSYLPHVIALVLFTVLSFAYFYPVIEGKVLKANDSMVAKINAKEIQDFRDKYAKEPLWTNSLFSGMPAYLISAKYPGNLFKHLDTGLRIFGMPVAVIFLSMLGFYILLLMFGLNPWLAIAGAVGYGLSSFLLQVIAAGHNTQAIALAYMAPMIGGVFVLEALTVILQVISFRFTGKRVFRMAPLHHHFELSGWTETQVVIRFWIVAIVFALFSLSTLKLR